MKNFHLLVSALLISGIGLAYGVCPGRILPRLFGFAVEHTSLKNIFRALMGLYLAMSSLWLIGVFNQKLWLTATITNIVFMAGLALGRIISLFSDGIPGIYFLAGIAVELLLAAWGIVNLVNFKRSITNRQ
ncbi:DUF4345 domain-containing protein [Sediminibacterium ginsengisoli]|uniref:DUF4345 domain-containing protein n=1 Tax=Sediminibacterium ginsengisoli TaxID=413434 RepID=A0A1T4JP31_9BACT|nr:DUF4345 domain-containing protein [Sediminibacterium ginsengisoli]SJZ31930.1 protein of unknown function [Sediminibacterium ginsengisoli]